VRLSLRLGGGVAGCAVLRERNTIWLRRSWAACRAVAASIRGREAGAEAWAAMRLPLPPLHSLRQREVQLPREHCLRALLVVHRHRSPPATMLKLGR